MRSTHTPTTVPLASTAISENDVEKLVSHHTAQASVGVHLEQLPTPRHKQGPSGTGGNTAMRSKAGPLPITALEEMTVRSPVTASTRTTVSCAGIDDNQITRGLHHKAPQP